MPGGIHAPVEVILTWPKPNYINPETRPNTILVLVCICCPITIILLLARLWVRVFHQRNPGWDDWLILVATVPTVALTIIALTTSQMGFDRHIWDINMQDDPQKLVKARKYILATECMFCIASGLIKASILLFYRRLSARTISATFRWVTWVTIGFIVASTFVFTLSPILGCKPISAYWDQVDIEKTLQGYHYNCLDEGADIFAASVVSVIQDFITATLPTFLYWNLQIPFYQRIKLFGIFSIGYGGVALGSIRAYYSWQTYYETYDITWSTWSLLLTTMLELHIGAFCANAPAITVFLKHFLNRSLAPQGKDLTKPTHTGQTYSKGSRSDRSTSIIPESAFFFLTRYGGWLSKDGYLSEPHTGVAVDRHGGVRVQKDIHITRDLSLTRSHASGSGLNEYIDTTKPLRNQYCDIELSKHGTSKSSQISRLQLLKTNIHAH